MSFDNDVRATAAEPTIGAESISGDAGMPSAMSFLLLTSRTHFVAVVVLLLLASVPADAATKVFLLAGQSNMGGAAGPDFDELPPPPPYDVPQSDVKIFGRFGDQYFGDDWHNVQMGFGRLPASFGPEVSFGFTLHNEIFPNDDIYLIKYGASATHLSSTHHEWNVNVDDGAGGELYQGFKSTVDAGMQKLASAGLSPTIAGMIWMQGESDALLGTAAAQAYATNLTDFIERVRTDFASPQMPVVVGRITTPWGNRANNTRVRNAQMTVPSQVGYASWIDTDDLQQNRHPNYVYHYGTQGQIDLGVRFANAISELSNVPEPSATILISTGVLTFLAVISYCCRLGRSARAAKS